MEEKSENIVYAGLFLRIVATFIDLMVLYNPLIFLEIIIGSQNLITVLLQILLWGVYASYLLSSRWRGTIGYKVLGLEVLDEQMQQLTFKEAVIRYILSLLSFFFILPLFMIFFTKRSQTFHDFYAKTIVIDKYQTYGEYLHSSIVKIRKLFLIILIVSAIPALPWAYYIISYAKMQHEQREYTYNTVYTLPNYKDEFLDDYERKLVKINNEFLDKQNEYMFFKLKVQEELLLSCVSKRYKLLGDEQYNHDAKYFIKNARNIQIKDNIQFIDATKKYEKIYLENNDEYEFKFIEQVIEQTKVNTKSFRCETNTPIEKTYDTFLTIYLSRQHVTENQIESDPWLKQIVEGEPDFWESYLKNKTIKSDQ